MECVQGALKSNSAEMVLKPMVQQTPAFDDLWSVNSNGQTADDFFVDNLLDFSEAPVSDEDEEQVCEVHTQEDTTLVLQNELHKEVVEEEIKDSSLSVITGNDLYVPADDVADLEWLSHFVDDSSAGYSLTVPAGILSVKPNQKSSDRKIKALGEAVWTGPPVQTKARSKRTRTGVRVWSLGSNSLGSNSLTDSSTSTSSSSETTKFLYNDLTQSAESLFGKRPAKKRAAADSGGQPRRCSHCLVQKTPQWRTGPLGAKTLCNACGVRFKSGRLLPEYRPACSPTFSSEIHSNNHRKVMEMRRKKDGEDGFAVEV